MKFLVKKPYPKEHVPEMPPRVKMKISSFALEVDAVEGLTTHEQDALQNPPHQGKLQILQMARKLLAVLPDPLPLQGDLTQNPPLT